MWCVYIYVHVYDHKYEYMHLNMYIMCVCIYVYEYAYVYAYKCVSCVLVYHCVCVHVCGGITDMNVDAYTNSHTYVLYKYVMCMHCCVFI